MIDKACLSATDLPSVTLTLTSASPSETFRPGCNLIPLFNLFLNKMFPARAWTASRSSRSCPTEWSGWSAWGTWWPSPPPRSWQPFGIFPILNSLFPRFRLWSWSTSNARSRPTSPCTTCSPGRTPAFCLFMQVWQASFWNWRKMFSMWDNLLW